LTRIYRKLARRVHPDSGGSDEKFVELNNAFQNLLEKIKQA
jgi:curved DNA-binding protein CbpA